MKKLLLYATGVSLFLSLSGCKKFLQEKSQDEVRPTTVNDLQELLMGEVYPAGQKSSSFNAYLDLMTDDMVSNFNPDSVSLLTYRRYEGPFTWKKDMYERMEATGVMDDIDTYAHYFRGIMACNVVLDNIDKMRGPDDSRGNVRGQALAMRSFFYFMLVNLYGQPYNAPGVDITTSPGVELNLSSIVKDALPKRASVKQIYDQVESDLLQARPLLEKYSSTNSKFRATDLFVYTLLSRMYLYMERWDDAKKYATLALQKNPNLFKLSTVSWPNPWDDASVGIYSINSPEIIWFGYASRYEYKNIGMNNAYGPLFFCLSPDLQSKYEYDRRNTTNRGDLRMRYYYHWDYADYDWTIYLPFIGQKASQNYSGTVKGMRVAELYLNRAEANIQLYLKNGDETLRQAALSDLNYLRSFRYDTRNVPYVNVNFSGTALRDFCRDERRRELSFEDHRWFDLRRYGMPEIHHTFQMLSTQAPVDYVLTQGDKRYVLPIPLSVLAKNPAMVPNP